MQYSFPRSPGRAAWIPMALGLLTGCVHAYTALDDRALPLDVALIPGCPSEPGGHLSMCEWRRVIWAEHLYSTGVVAGFITSGNAVHSPYVEADALAAGLIALGVPDRVILRERQALHTDQNVAYSLALLDHRRAEEGLRVGPVIVATDRGQARGMCSMVQAWRSSFPQVSSCLIAPIDDGYAYSRMMQGVPEVTTEALPDWQPLSVREATMAEQSGYRRPPSFWVYTSQGFLNLFGLSRPPR